MQHLRNQIDQIEDRIFYLNDNQIKHDLHKMIMNVDLMIDELSREAVECRRLNSLQRANTATPKYLALSKQIGESIYKMEKYLTMYSLLG